VKDKKVTVTVEELTKKNRRSMREILEEGGITDEYLRTKLKKEMTATDVKTYNNKGRVIYSDPMIAWEIRQRARQDAHKLRGDYPAEKHEIDEDHHVEIINYAKGDKKTNP
jgi:osmotically-inducible protein OsmY